MSKKRPKRTLHPSSDRDVQSSLYRLRELAADTALNCTELRSLASNLRSHDVNPDDLYLIETDLEQIAGLLFTLVAKDNRRSDTMPASAILASVSDEYGIDDVAAVAFADLETALSTFWYDEPQPAALKEVCADAADSLDRIIDMICGGGEV